MVWKEVWMQQGLRWKRIWWNKVDGERVLKPANIDRRIWTYPNLSQNEWDPDQPHLISQDGLSRQTPLSRQEGLSRLEGLEGLCRLDGLSRQAPLNRQAHLVDRKDLVDRKRTRPWPAPLSRQDGQGYPLRRQLLIVVSYPLCRQLLTVVTHFVDSY
jgi:hypothetical protein